MANKKGGGVAGVLGNFVTKGQERREQPSETARPAVSAQSAEERHEPTGSPKEETSPPKKVGVIKGRPRAKKDDSSPSKGGKTKVTLSIEETLRERFYRLAHAEMIQPGEYLERAIRYYMDHHKE